VSLQMRVELAGALLAEDIYSSSVPAAGSDIPATVQAFGTALDQVNASFVARLAQIKLPAGAGS
jgi:ABC-type uncharacterized transport system auxiliary subunit